MKTSLYRYLYKLFLLFALLPPSTLFAEVTTRSGVIDRIELSGDASLDVGPTWTGSGGSLNATIYLHDGGVEFLISRFIQTAADRAILLSLLGKHTTGEPVAVTGEETVVPCSNRILYQQPDEIIF